MPFRKSAAQNRAVLIVFGGIAIWLTVVISIAAVAFHFIAKFW